MTCVGAEVSTRPDRSRGDSAAELETGASGRAVKLKVEGREKALSRGGATRVGARDVVREATS